MSIADLLGGDLPQGLNISIKTGDGNGSTARRALGETPSTPTTPKTSCPEGQTWNPTLGRCVPENPPLGGKCPEGYVFNQLTRRCVPIGETERGGQFESCPEGYRWSRVLGRCIKSGALTTCPEGYYWNGVKCVPREAIYPSGTVSNEQAYNDCIAAGGTPDHCSDVTGYIPGGQTTLVDGGDGEDGGEADGGGKQCPAGEHWNAIAQACEPDIITPYEPPEVQGTEDWTKYRDMIMGDDEFDVEMRYWNTQKDEINRAFDEGWNEAQSIMAAEGYGYSSALGQYKVAYDVQRERALRDAYNEIMYTGLQRHLDKIKLATDFFLGDKALDITHAYQQGQLDLATLRAAVEEKLGWAGIGIEREQLEIALMHAVTEAALADATMDQMNTTIFMNFMQLAAELGISEEKASFIPRHQPRDRHRP